MAYAHSLEPYRYYAVDGTPYVGWRCSFCSWVAPAVPDNSDVWLELECSARRAPVLDPEPVTPTIRRGTGRLCECAAWIQGVKDYQDGHSHYCKARRRR